MLVQPDPKGSDKSTRWDLSLAAGRYQSFILASSPCMGLAFDIPNTPTVPAAHAAVTVRVGRIAFFSSDSQDQPILVLDCDPAKSSAALSASVVKLDLVLPTLLLEAGSRYRPRIKAELQAALQEASGSPLLRTSGWGGLGKAERDAVQSGLADAADRTGAYGTAGDTVRQIRDGGLLYTLAETIGNVERETWSASIAPGFGQAIRTSLPQLRPDGRPPGNGMLSWSRLWSSLVRMHLVTLRAKPHEVTRADRFELRIARRATGADGPRPGDGDLLTSRLDLAGQKLWLAERQPPGWASRAGSTPTPCQPVLLVKGISTPSVLAVWSGLLARYHAGLRSIRNERPVSLLPGMLTPLAPSPTWTLAVRAETARLTTPRLVIGGEDGDTSPGPVQLRVAATALQVHSKIGNPGSPGLDLGQFTLAAQTDSKLEQVLAEMTAPDPIRTVGLRQPLFRLTLTAATRADPTAPAPVQPDPAEVRLGAFDLTLRGKLREPQASTLSLEVIETAIHVVSTLYLPVTVVKPGGQDRAARDDARPPVLISMDPAVLPESPFQLQADETALPRERQKVIFKLSSQSGSTPARKLVVIDTEPFSVMLVTMPALVPQEANSLLAEWSSDDPEGGASWRVAAQAEGYDILLPPQAIGESAIRDKQNWPDDTPRFADFRFGQNAALRVFTSYRRNLVGLTPPPFNTRMLFGNALQRLPGAPVAQAELELLYGLRASISNRPDIFATELTADLGIVPILNVELPGETPGFENNWGKKANEARMTRVKRARDLDRRVTRGFRSRLAVLSLHPQKPDGVPAEQRIEAGVEFLLRTKVLKTKVDRTGETDMLDGGATSGFESQNILDEVLRTPKGNGGELFGVHLSPLGAWGGQRAFFASRKSVIASRAGQGRTHFYSIERVGRIGVFWNRCKHVIIYERTVQPADQFASDQPKEEGRPLLRKVREYVEVMQATRRFPEQPTAPARRGCVEALICRRTIIPVNSKWGQDIPNGWRLPLWNPAVQDSPHDRRVYPKPHLELQMAGDASAATGPGFAPIDTPEKLVFYTSTRFEDTDDTDTWAPVAGIDYALGPVPTAPAVRTHDPNDKDGMLPSDRPMLAGLEAFTFGLDRAAPVASNIVAARAEKPVTALLSNVTLMRPAPEGAKGHAVDLAPLLEGARRHADHLREQVGDMRIALARMVAAPEQTLVILKAVSVGSPEVVDPAITSYLEYAKKLHDKPVDVGGEVSDEIKRRLPL